MIHSNQSKMICPPPGDMNMHDLDLTFQGHWRYTTICRILCDSLSKYTWPWVWPFWSKLKLTSESQHMTCYQWIIVNLCSIIGVIAIQHMHDLVFDLFRSLKVKADGASKNPKYDFLLVSFQGHHRSKVLMPMKGHIRLPINDYWPLLCSYLVWFMKYSPSYIKWPQIIL